MPNRLLILAHAEARRRAEEAVREAPDGWMVEVKPPRRTTLQNSMFHAICQDFEKSRHPWMGEPRTAAGWKRLLVSAHAVATGDGAELTVGLEGELVDLRESTALMSVRRGSSLIEYALAYAHQNGIPIVERRFGD